MSAVAVTVFAAMVVVYVSVSAVLDRHAFSAPMFFALGGAGLGLIRHVPTNEPGLKTLTEATLAMILFHDAAMVKPGQLRRDSGISARLLLLGLPLTIVAGVATAHLLMPAATIWAALYLASALAPTDAGLGAATVLNPVVPERVRRVLNVESGLNDGLSTPVVLLAISAVAATGASQEHHVLAALQEIVLGVGVGVLVGASVGLLLRRAAARDLATPSLVPLATVVVPLLAYYGAGDVGGNGFVAAFVSGTAFAAAHLGRRRTASGRVGTDDASTHGGRTPSGGTRHGGKDEERHDAATELTESISALLGYAVWAIFGLIAMPHLREHLTWAAAAFAVLSLTVLRMGPVALVLIGTGLRRRTVAFIGWFGPRGLASVVFTLIAVESLQVTPAVDAVLAAVELTVLLSVVLHGATAGPWARAYGDWASRVRPPVELELTRSERA